MIDVGEAFKVVSAGGGEALVAELVVATYRNLARSSLYYVVQSGEVSESILYTVVYRRRKI